MVLKKLPPSNISLPPSPILFPDSPSWKSCLSGIKLVILSCPLLRAAKYYSSVGSLPPTNAAGAYYSGYYSAGASASASSGSGST